MALKVNYPTWQEAIRQIVTHLNFLFPRVDALASIVKLWGVPVGIAPTGTMANNGAVTLGTALPLTYTNGIWLYFPSGAIEAGSAAGIYWCKMSSTTLGTVYNTTLSGREPYIPASDVAFATTGPGAYTGSTSEITLATVPIKGGAMGRSGQVVTEANFWNYSSANNKTSKIKFGGNSIFSLNHTTNVTASIRKIVNNIGITGTQAIWHTSASDPGLSGGSYSSISVDTTAETSITITGQLAAATDPMILFSGYVELRPGI